MQIFLDSKNLKFCPHLAEWVGRGCLDDARDEETSVILEHCGRGEVEKGRGLFDDVRHAHKR